MTRRLPSAWSRGTADRSAGELEIRLLGGFEVLRDGASCERFESQRTRALLAYLACHRGQAVARDGLASLLWPEEDPSAARRNLRQAIYNLRLALGPGGREPSMAVVSDHQTARLRLDLDSWLDVDAFDRAVAAGFEAEGHARLRGLTRAAQLYRGDFLAGFQLEGSEAFEDWLVAERERLREAAIQALLELVPVHGARGDDRLAIRSARRLVELDPLSEAAHRELMRLYARTGRRERALAQFEDLGELLARELGVRPTGETVELHRSIRDHGRSRPDDGGAPAEPVGPFVPLVGREEAARRLDRSFRDAIDDGARLLLIEGLAGAGKTRLAKTALHRLTSEHRPTVLLGRCYPAGPSRSFQPFGEVVSAVEREALNRRGRELADELTGLLPVAEETGSATGRRPPPEGSGRRVPALLAELLRNLCRPAGRAQRPVVVFLDDLQWADGPTVELLDRLLGELTDRPVWFLATLERLAAGHDHPVRVLADGGDRGGRIEVMRLEPLADGDAVASIASSLGAGGDGARLAAFLATHGEGLPLRMVELINLLSDDGILAADAQRGWEIVAVEGLGGVGVLGALDEIILRRVARLPSSAHRLIELAAVIGQTFDVGLLQRAANEHIGVVEIGIEQMLERWLIRQFPRYWTADPRERDLVLWARGARRGIFEFAHYRIREAVYRDLNPLARQRLHRQVAQAMGDEAVEVLAYHWERSGDARRAVPYLLRSADYAAALGDPSAALGYCRRAQAALERAAGNGGGEAGERRALETLRARLRVPLDAS